MKIALVHMRHANTGGTELFLKHLSRYLAEQGEDVTIICRSHVEPSHPAIKFVKLKPLGIGKAHRMWQFAKAVEKHVKAEDYDFVYSLGKTWTHDMLRIGGGTHHHFMKASKRKNLRWKDRVALTIEQKAIAPDAYHLVVANSNKCAEEIHEAYGVPKDKITVIHNFVETRRFNRSTQQEAIAQVKAELKLDDSKPTFLFLGTGYDRKGLKPALKAFAMLQFPANFLIVGRENNQAEYQKLAQSLGIAEDCYFLGSQDKPEIYFSMADCYLLPAYYEPFGFTVIEALSCGTPVITTENCGAKEVVSPEVATIISESVRSEDLAEAMTHWAAYKDDESLRQKCRDQAMHLDVDAMMEKNYQQILSVYRKKVKS